MNLQKEGRSDRKGTEKLISLVREQTEKTEIDNHKTLRVEEMEG